MEEINICLCGSGMIGKTTAMEFLGQHAKKIKKIKLWKEHVDTDIIFTSKWEILEPSCVIKILWLLGSFFYRSSITSILHDTQGILYFSSLQPMTLGTQREELIQFMDDYTQTIATPFHQFPVVFCYNKSDKLLQWLQEQEQRDGPIPQEDLAQVPTEPPIFLPQKQGEQIIDIPAPLPAHHHILSVWNRVLNPWNHPFFVTSALWGTNIETALLRLIELVIYRKDHGALDGNAYDGQPPTSIDEDE